MIVQRKYIELKNEISDLYDKLQEIKDQINLVESQLYEMKCNHKNMDGTSAIRESWNWDICNICGDSF